VERFILEEIPPGAELLSGFVDARRVLEAMERVGYPVRVNRS
jgi:hypothetical protein